MRIREPNTKVGSPRNNTWKLRKVRIDGIDQVYIFLSHIGRKKCGDRRKGRQASTRDIERSASISILNLEPPIRKQVDLFIRSARRFCPIQLAHISSLWDLFKNIYYCRYLLRYIVHAVIEGLWQVRSNGLISRLPKLR